MNDHTKPPEEELVFKSSQNPPPLQDHTTNNAPLVDQRSVPLEQKEENLVNKDSDVEIAKSPNRHHDEKVDVDLMEKLPPYLKNICNCFKSKQKEMILFSSLAVISSVLPNVYGEYAGHKVYPNFYIYIVGRASSGKGDAKWTRQLISSIENGSRVNPTANSILKELKEKSSDSKLFLSRKIIIPANNSTAGFTELLNERGGRGLIFETEGDPMAEAFKSDYGNYSYIFRQAFHHEPVTQYRKTDKQEINILEPKISALITSTPNQMKSIISSPENGLFSRFGFVFTEPVEKFLNVFDKAYSNRGEIFDKASDDLADLYDRLLESDEIEIVLNKEQEQQFVKSFDKYKSLLTNLYHEDLDGSANRMGVITFRIMSILTVLRNMTSVKLEVKYTCSDQDFELSIKLAEKLLFNAKRAFDLLPRKGTDTLSEVQRALFAILPDEFTTKIAKELGKDLLISDRSIDRFLNSAVFEKEGFGKYKKAD